MALSKSKRFEIFKRDGFTCQYCGMRPPDVVLEVDHIDPRSKGGSDDELNLITACFDCNRGKAAKKLTDIHPRPDADLKYLEAQQEIAEVKAYLKSKEELDSIREQICSRLLAVWKECLIDTYVPTDKQFGCWLAWYSPEEIEFAIRRSSGKYQSGAFSGRGQRMECDGCVRYVSGILKSVAQENKDNG